MFRLGRSQVNANARGVQRWYFVVHGRRSGDDLPLRRAAQPLSPAELGDVVGGVRVADSPADEAAQTRVAGQSANAGSSSTG